MSEAYETPAPRRALSIGEAFGFGWPAFKQFYGLVLAVLVIYILFAMAIMVTQGAIEQLIGLKGILSIPVSLFVTSPLAAGLSYFGVRCVRGEAVKIEDMFWGFKRYWVMVGIQGLFLLSTLAVVLPIAMVLIVTSAMGTSTQSVTPFALFAIFGLGVGVVAAILGLRFGFAFQVALDERCAPAPGVVDSLRLSWRITGSGNWAVVFVLALLLGVIAIASVLALILPVLFFAMPLGLVVWGAAYHMMARDYGIALDPPEPEAA